MDTQTNLLSDDELDTVAGGMMMAFTPSPVPRTHGGKSSDSSWIDPLLAFTLGGIPGLLGSLF